MAHSHARERKWKGNWRMELEASTLHTTSEYGVSSITTSDAHNSAASSQLNWRPRRFKWTHPFRRKTKSGFCTCAITFQKQSTTPAPAQLWNPRATANRCKDFHWTKKRKQEWRRKHSNGLREISVQQEVTHNKMRFRNEFSNLKDRSLHIMELRCDGDSLFTWNYLPIIQGHDPQGTENKSDACRRRKTTTQEHTNF